LAGHSCGRWNREKYRGLIDHEASMIRYFAKANVALAAVLTHVLATAS
jgi:hypothetical protein